MTPHRPSSPTPAADVTTEAARYALLRRLAFAIRHDMMADLQPITMTGEVLERRLASPQPELGQLREAAGLSQQECADRLGVTSQTVISIEKGHFDPRLSLAFRISRTFVVPVDELFTPEDG